MIQLPERLVQFARSGRPGGVAWVERLPGIVEQRLDEWQLELAQVRDSSFSFVADVTRTDGSAAVLKVALPEPGAADEIDALLRWDGRGAVRALAAHRDDAALLLEAAVPGTPLWDVDDDDERLAVAAQLLRRLWLPVSSSTSHSGVPGTAASRSSAASSRCAASARTAPRPSHRRRASISSAAPGSGSATFNRAVLPSVRLTSATKENEDSRTCVSSSCHSSSRCSTMPGKRSTHATPPGRPDRAN